MPSCPMHDRPVRTVQKSQSMQQMGRKYRKNRRQHDVRESGALAGVDEDLLARAGAGDAGAQEQVGLYCLDHAGSKQERRQALHWLEQAAAQGSPSAQKSLAEAILSGRAGHADMRKGVLLLEQAAARDCPDAMRVLGMCHRVGHGVPADAAIAADCWRRAAQAGDTEAAMLLGCLYLDGDDKVQVDAAQARIYLEQAADAGILTAMDRLGLMYLQGQGCRKNYRKAREWLERGAAGGSADAVMGLTTRMTRAWAGPGIRSGPLTASTGWQSRAQKAPGSGREAGRREEH